MTSAPARPRTRASSRRRGTCSGCGARRRGRANGGRSGCSPGQAVEDTEAREAQSAKELAGQGHLLRLWRLPGQGRALGLWRARDAAEMQAILASLPLDAWMTVETTPLSEHPSDPALATS